MTNETTGKYEVPPLNGAARQESPLLQLARAITGGRGSSGRWLFTDDDLRRFAEDFTRVEFGLLQFTALKLAEAVEGMRVAGGRLEFQARFDEAKTLAGCLLSALAAPPGGLKPVEGAYLDANGNVALCQKGRERTAPGFGARLFAWPASGAPAHGQTAFKAPVPNAAAHPNFDAIKDMRIGDMTPEQRADAKELWLRNNLGWMPTYHRGFYEFLLSRLDAERARRTAANLELAQQRESACTWMDRCTELLRVLEAAPYRPHELPGGKECQCGSCEFIRLRHTALAQVKVSDPAFPERDTAKSTEEQGIFRKFDVRRADGSSAPGGKHHSCRYFVLDLDCDKYAPTAMRAYANACLATHPQLSAEIIDEFGAAPAVAAADIRKALSEVVQCFDAALSEGLNAALAETADERLKDLVERRLMHALYAVLDAGIEAKPEGGASC